MTSDWTHREGPRESENPSDAPTRVRIVRDFGFANLPDRINLQLVKVSRCTGCALVSTGEIAFGVVILLASLPLLRQPSLAEAADNAADTAAASAAGQYQALVKEYEAAQQEFSRAYGAARTDEERQKLSEKYPQPQAWSRRLLELVRKNPKTQVAADALIWVVTNDRYGENLDEALEILLQDHVEDEKLGQVAQMLVYSNAKHPETALEILLQKNPHHEVQGKARFSLGLVNRSQDKNAEAEKLFEQVMDRFGDIQNYRGTLADAARGQLFEMRNLAIGKIAPEIEGEDLDGKSFKLSDYRGKIVVLDFWGDW